MRTFPPAILMPFDVIRWTEIVEKSFIYQSSSFIPCVMSKCIISYESHEILETAAHRWIVNSSSYKANYYRSFPFLFFYYIFALFHIAMPMEFMPVSQSWKLIKSVWILNSQCLILFAANRYFRRKVLFIFNSLWWKVKHLSLSARRIRIL